MSLAVRKMIGVCRDRSWPRMSLAVSNPSMPGIRTSSRMTANSCEQGRQGLLAGGPDQVSRQDGLQGEQVGRLVVPMVETAEQAAHAVAACRYATDGIRSFGALRDPSPGAPVCLVMVETRTGLENVDEIVRVPGLDGIYIGPSDLALSLGLQPTLTLEHPPVLEAIERVRTACAAAGLLCGLHCLTAEDALKHRDEGFAMVTAGTDVMLLKSGLAATLGTARGAA